MKTKVMEVNTSIYPLDVIYSVAYIFLDKYYISLDGDPKNIIRLSLTPKDKNLDSEKIESEVNNFLITYSFYKNQSSKNSSLRQMMLQAALFASEEVETAQDTNTKEDIELPEELKDADYLEDPEGIAIPWEIKYKKNKGS